MACRLMVDAPASGAWNMAVDEVLLGWAAASGGCCLRIYRWEEPTLSLGYFQEYGDRSTHEPSRHCPVVRRSSGGGAILHDEEWTYSLALPAAHPLALRRLSLYRAVHMTLIDQMAHYGLTASLCPGDVRGPQPSPFLCFLRRSEGDVLVDGHKVAGSAQRRKEGAVLQHGSVLLGCSPAAPELPGLRELSARPIDSQEFLDGWLARLCQELAVTTEPGGLTDQERQLARGVLEAKFGCSGWTQSRGRQSGAVANC